VLKDRFRSFMVFLGLAEEDYDDGRAPADSDRAPYSPPAGSDTYDAPWASPATTPVSQSMPAPPLQPRSSVSVIDGSGAPQPTAAPPAARPPQRPTSSVRPITTMAHQDIDVFVPLSYDDSKRVGDELRARRPLVVNLSSVDADLSRRITDFASGVVYTIGGQIRRIDHHVYLLSPPDVRVAPESIDRLRQRNFAPARD
jgi:cell division inhibitor SepF